MPDTPTWTSLYPSALDTETNQPGPASGGTVWAADMKKLKESVHAVEEEVGKLTSPDPVSVRGRLAAVETDLATTQSDLAVVEGDLTTVQGDLSAAQGDIVTIQGTLASGVITPPTDLVTGGVLVYHGGAWKNGVIDNFNNSVIDPRWTQNISAGWTFAEDASKLRMSCTAGAAPALGGYVEQQIPDVNIDARVYMAVNAGINSRVQLAIFTLTRLSSICAEIVNNGGAYQFWLSDPDGFVNAGTPGGTSSFWVRLRYVYNYAAVSTMMYSTNASNDIPTEDEWTVVLSRTHSAGRSIRPEIIGLEAHGWGGNAITSADFSSLQVTFK